MPPAFNHINVATPGTPAIFTPLFSRGFLDALPTLQSIINLLARAAPGGAGTIYFPPGVYPIAVPMALAPLVPAMMPARSQFDRRVIGPRLLVIPPEVNLHFAPGAILQLPFGTNIEIRGGLIAGRQQIFQTTVPAPGIPPIVPAGTVLFTGDKVTEIYPEWWGARGTSAGAVTFPSPSGVVNLPINDTNALQAAIDAGYNHRTLPAYDYVRNVTLTDTVRLPAIPVVLESSYVITSTLVVGDANFPTAPDVSRSDGFIMRGSLGTAVTDVAPGAYRSFVAQNIATSSIVATAVPGSAGFLGEATGDTAGIGFAMMTLRGVPGYTIENVSFDGGFMADVCVRLARARQTVLATAFGAERQRQPPLNGSFRGCTFQGAARYQVYVGAQLPSFYLNADSVTPTAPGGIPMLGPATGLRSDLDASGLTFDRCFFRPTWRRGPNPEFSPLADPDPNRSGEAAFLGGTSPRDFFPPPPPPMQPLSIATEVAGIVLRTAYGAGVHFKSCRFEGDASAMIWAFNGAFSLTGCTFWNRRRPSSPRRPRADAPDGVDIFLAQPPLEPRAGAMASAPAYRPPMASFGASHCDSRSWQFLATAIGGPETFAPAGRWTAPVPGVAVSAAPAPTRPSVLLNVRHGNFNLPAPPRPRGSGPAPGAAADPLAGNTRASIEWRAPAKLILVSCDFDGVIVGAGSKLEAIATAFGRTPLSATVATTARAFVYEPRPLAEAGRVGTAGFREEWLPGQT